jgi:ATP-dependent DNA helicase RecG
MKTMTYEEILSAVKIGENTDWEFKSAKGGFPGSFWETYSAMANTDGGVIVLGLKETNDGVIPDSLTGEQVAQYKKKIWDDVHNRSTISLNLLQNNHIQEIPIDNGYLLTITIPVATRKQRPVYCTTTPFGHTYRRNHQGDYHLQDDEVRRMFADSDPDATADMKILDDFSFSDIDAPSIAQYRQRFRSVKGDHPWLSLDDRELFEKLGGWRLDRRTDSEGLTVAGLLMFGKFEAITDQYAVPGYFVDYREKLDPAMRWTDRIYPDGTWEPNLFQFYQRVWPKLAQGLPVPFQLEQGIRKDDTPAHEALRESFVNALIHADYRGAGGVVIERLPDRFVFDNPGILLVSLEQYRRGGISECRNKSLQQMFSMIGGGERAGSGVDKIKAGWNSRHWRSPWLTLNSQPDRVQLSLPMISLIPDNVIAGLKNQFKDRLSNLKPNEIQALATAQIEGSVSNARLQEFVNDHPVDISHMLQKLCEAGFLISDNKKRWSTYHIANQSGLPLFNQLNDDSKLSTSTDSIHNDEKTSMSSTDSIYNDEKTSMSSTDSIYNEASTEPGQEEVLRQIIAPIVGKKRVKPDLMRQIILKLCSNRFLTLETMAKLLNRNSAAFRNQYISPMVNEAVLMLKYPETPNRPDQAYTAKENT